MIQAKQLLADAKKKKEKELQEKLQNLQRVKEEKDSEIVYARRNSRRRKDTESKYSSVNLNEAISKFNQRLKQSK